jgi:hypothetical protein
MGKRPNCAARCGAFFADAGRRQTTRRRALRRAYASLTSLQVSCFAEACGAWSNCFRANVAIFGHCSARRCGPDFWRASPRFIFSTACKPEVGTGALFEPAGNIEGRPVRDRSRARKSEYYDSLTERKEMTELEVSTLEIARSLPRAVRIPRRRVGNAQCNAPQPVVCSQPA